MEYLGAVNVEFNVDPNDVAYTARILTTQIYSEVTLNTINLMYRIVSLP
jgi:hypothetical protein